MSSLCNGPNIYELTGDQSLDTPLVSGFLAGFQVSGLEDYGAEEHRATLAFGVPNIEFNHVRIISHILGKSSHRL
jgi:hypothetical protein